MSEFCGSLFVDTSTITCSPIFTPARLMPGAAFAIFPFVTETVNKYTSNILGGCILQQKMCYKSEGNVDNYILPTDLIPINLNVFCIQIFAVVRIYHIPKLEKKGLTSIRIEGHKGGGFWGSYVLKTQKIPIFFLIPPQGKRWQWMNISHTQFFQQFHHLQNCHSLWSKISFSFDIFWDWALILKLCQYVSDAFS